jgi:hypothetical protein
MAQRSIADRLLSSQGASAYAAEALPHFLVVIKDSDRAFALADSISFPATVQSEFGRRRLTLARLRAAFRLAVAEDDFDRVLGLSMRLAQAATANMRGDEFIRRSPALAIILGDADSYRRLSSDRSGWRGARSARLTVAHCLAGDSEEAQIQCESTIRWINWHIAQPRDETTRDRPGPGVDDYAAALFQHVAEGNFHNVDRNLARWNDRFAQSASAKLLQLLELFDQANDTTALANFISFAASEQSKSQALKLQLLLRPRYLNSKQAKALAKAVGTPAPAEDRDSETLSTEADPGNSGNLAEAALTALLHGSRAAAAAIVRRTPRARPSAYDYGERHGHSRAWSPIQRACVRAWSAGRRVAYHDLLPNEVKVTRRAKALSTKADLDAFLKELPAPATAGTTKRIAKKQSKPRFSQREREDICQGIELALDLMRPIEDAVLTGEDFASESVSAFLEVWGKHQREGVQWRAERPADWLLRSAALGYVHMLLTHAQDITSDQADVLVGLISSGRFFVQQKIDVLRELAHRPALHVAAGKFAQHIAKQIGQDDNIGHRGESYAELAASLVPVSVDEAREYYRQGLAQLDQMGGKL